MELSCYINGRRVTKQIDADMVLLDFLREQGCYSVKRGCDTANCGLCTVWVEQEARACPAPPWRCRAQGRHIAHPGGTSEGRGGVRRCSWPRLRRESSAVSAARAFHHERALPWSGSWTTPPTRRSGSIWPEISCRCTGYVTQLRAVKEFLAYKKEQREGGKACRRTMKRQSYQRGGRSHHQEGRHGPGDRQAGVHRRTSRPGTAWW